MTISELHPALAAGLGLLLQQLLLGLLLLVGLVSPGEGLEGERVMDGRRHYNQLDVALLPQIDG